MKQCRWLLAIVILLTAGSTFALSRGQRGDLAIPMNTTFPWTTSQLCVQYVSPTGRTFTGHGFWDSRSGSTDTFRIRAAFDEVGTWQYMLINAPGCVSTANVAGAVSGSIGILADTSNLPLRADGPVRVSGHHLVYGRTNAPFHWIGDTSWAGPHKAPIAGWQGYTSNRQTKGFTVIQVAVPIGQGTIAHADFAASPPTTPFYDPANPAGTACNTGPLPRAGCFPRKAFWDAWDAHIEDINAKGMLAAVIGLYKRTDEGAGQKWPTITDSKGYARFIAARLAGNYTALAPGFDELPNVAVNDFTTRCFDVQQNPGEENQACRAREVGNAIKQAVFLQAPIGGPRTGTPLSAVVTHHIGGSCPNGGDGTSTCVADAWWSTFHAEGWLDFDLVQSGQGLPGNCTLSQPACIAKRASTRMLRLYNIASPVKPVVNGEAIYDNNGYQKCGTLNDHYKDLRPRHAAFNTLLSGGAGFTHGVGGTWDWPGSVTCRSVSESLASASSTQFGNLRTAFSTLPWHRLKPDCQVWGTACTDVKNNEQAGNNAAWELKRMYAYDSSGLFAVAYLPVGVADTSLKLNLDNLPGYTNALPWRAQWYNPRAGCLCNATPINAGGTTWSFNRPNSAVDWALIVRNQNLVSVGVGACMLSADCP